MKKFLKIAAIVIASLALAFAAFCAGIVYTMEHQTIMGEGAHFAANIEGWEWYYYNNA